MEFIELRVRIPNVGRQPGDFGTVKCTAVPRRSNGVERPKVETGHHRRHWLVRSIHCDSLPVTVNSRRKFDVVDLFDNEHTVVCTTFRVAIAIVEAYVRDAVLKRINIVPTSFTATEEF